jgi:hypothetical protein
MPDARPLLTKTQSQEFLSLYEASAQDFAVCRPFGGNGSCVPFAAAMPKDALCPSSGKQNSWCLALGFSTSDFGFL